VFKWKHTTHLPDCKVILLNFESTPGALRDDPCLR